MNEYRKLILRTVGKYIQTQHEENGVSIMGVNDHLFPVEVILQTLDDMIREEEAPKQITLGDVLYLIDPDGEGDDQIALMDCNGEAALMGPTKSKYWEAYEAKQVSGITAAGRAMKVWLKEEEEETE